MASVNFLKIKNRANAHALMKHCDKDERVKNNHSNEDINKSMTHKNAQMKLSVSQSMEKFKKRIDELDKTTNTNKRKDRVELFSLEIPAPENLSDKKENLWFVEIYKILCDEIKENNIINMYVHKDEKHMYIDHGEEKFSRNHIHVFCVPEINGKLNGKEFSSKQRMKDINKKIDDMTREKFHVAFMTNAKPSKHYTVEELKAHGAKEIEKSIQKMQKLNKDMQKLDERIQIKAKRYQEIASELKDRESDLKALKEAISEQKTLYNQRQRENLLLDEELNDLETKKQQILQELSDFAKNNPILWNYIQSEADEREKETAFLQADKVINSENPLPDRGFFTEIEDFERTLGDEYDDW